MDRATILKFLAVAEEHVADGEVAIAKQRSIVEHQTNAGQDASVAVSLLQQFERAQALHTADRDRLRAELESAT